MGSPDVRAFKGGSFARVALAIIIAALVFYDLGPLCSLRSAFAEEEDAHPEHSDERHDEREQHDEVVRLSRSVMEEFGVEVDAAGPARIDTYIALPAEIEPNADRLAHIVPRFAGLVTEVRKNAGDRVRAGDVLAVIESSESLTPYELKTFIDGTVIAKRIARGEAVTQQTQTFVVADLETVWLDISVYQRDLPKVRVGQSVIVSAGQGEGESTGTISYVTPIVDEKTRTAIARVVLSNADGRWRPGMFVLAHVLVDTAEVPVAIPVDAPQTVDAQRVVFVESQHGFSPRPVRLGRSDQTRVEVLSGLLPGERYAARGSFTLKAELQRDQLVDEEAD